MIFTFYSFKGGVGRSMALANVAELLVQRGVTVLMIDFDLEAPGLERFFDVPGVITPPALAQESRGVIDLLMSYRQLRSLPLIDPGPSPAALEAEPQGPNSFPYPVEPLRHFVLPLTTTSGSGSLMLMPAGQRGATEYARYADRIRSFNWEELYLRWNGEAFFEWFRHEAESFADVVLIDSRTGITELAGVCTFQLADVVIVMVAPNEQNLEGCLTVAKSLQDPLLIEEERRGRPLRLLPVPSRVDNSESNAVTDFRVEFDRQLLQFVPPELTFDNSAFIDLKIPYVPRYSFKEIVAVREPDVAAASDLIAAYGRLTSAIVELAGQSSRVFQIFHAPTLPTSEVVAEAVEDFTGRQWVLDRINMWLGADGPPLMTITGPPGSGKTSLSRWLALAGRADLPNVPLLDAVLVYAHFCNPSNDRSLDGREFLQTLTVRLASVVPGYASVLLTIRHPGIVVDAKQSISATRPSGTVAEVVIDQLILGDISAHRAFEELIRRPLQGMPVHDRPMLVIVDGIDSELRAGGNDAIVDLLGTALKAVPRGLRFLVTSRGDPQVLSLLDGLEIDLLNDLPPGIDDVREYAMRRLASRPTKSGETLATVVSERSEGNFLYARWLLDELERDPSASPDGLPDRPSGVDEFYREELRQQFGSGLEGAEQQLLGLLAVAHEPLSAVQMASAASRSIAEVQVSLRTLAHFLVGRFPDGPFQLFHTSLRDFLLVDSTFRIYADEANLALANSFIRQYGPTWLDCEDTYALRHTLTHLLAAVKGTGSQAQRKEALDATADLIGIRTSFLTAKAGRLGSSSMIADIDAAIGLLDRYSSTPEAATRLRDGLSELKVWLEREDVKRLEAHILMANLMQNCGRLVASGYAKAYEEIRLQLPSGAKRTRLMDGLVNDVRRLMDLAEVLKPDTTELLSAGPGERVVGLAILQSRPDLRSFEAVRDAVRKPRSPFEQYHALRAANRMVSLFDDDQKRELHAALRAEQRDESGMGAARDASRAQQIAQLLDRLTPPRAEDDYFDLDIVVRRTEVSFGIGGRDYGGVPDFGKKTLNALRDLRLEGSPDDYGSALGRAAFRHDAESGLMHLNELLDAGDKWRLRFHIDGNAPELSQLRWECLSRQGEAAVRRRLGTSPKTPFSRYLSMQGNSPALTIDTLRILVVISNPIGLGHGNWEPYDNLDEDAERKVLEAALAGLPRVEYEFLGHPCSIRSIRERLLDDGFHVLHVVGHGFRDVEQRASLLLESERRTEVEVVDQARLTDLVADLYDLRLIMLAGCHSVTRSDTDAFLELGLAMVHQGVPAVIAMQDLLGQMAATEFAARFYWALMASSKTSGVVDASVNLARERLMQRKEGEANWTWSAPALFMRGTGRLFELSRNTRRQSVRESEDYVDPGLR